MLSMLIATKGPRADVFLMEQRLIVPRAQLLNLACDATIQGNWRANYPSCTSQSRRVSVFLLLAILEAPRACAVLARLLYPGNMLQK